MRSSRSITSPLFPGAADQTADTLSESAEKSAPFWFTNGFLLFRAGRDVLIPIIQQKIIFVLVLIILQEIVFVFELLILSDLIFIRKRLFYFLKIIVIIFNFQLSEISLIDLVFGVRGFFPGSFQPESSCDCHCRA